MIFSSHSAQMLLYDISSRQFTARDMHPDPEFGYPCWRDGAAHTVFGSKFLIIGGLWTNVVSRRSDIARGEKKFQILLIMRYFEVPSRTDDDHNDK